MLKEIKLRLTIINAAVLFLVLMVVLSFTYAMNQAKIADTSRKEDLSLMASIRRFTPYLEKDMSNLDEELQTEYNTMQNSLRNTNSGYVVLDTQGNTLRSSSNVFLNPDIVRAFALNYYAPPLDEGYSIINQPEGTYVSYDYSNDISNYRMVSTLYENDKQEERILVFVKNTSGEKKVLSNFSTILVLSVLTGTVLCFVCSYFLATRSLVPIQETLERQNKFVADASHELRTPLSVVQTNLEVSADILADQQSDAAVWVNNAYEETIRMQKLVKSLLFLARFDERSEKVDMHKIDVVYLIKDVCEKLMLVAAQKQISIDFDSDRDEIFVYANRDMLIQLFTILIDNAVKFSPLDAIITIRTFTFASKTRIEVSDTGVGMDDETKEHVFERFYMGDGARSKKEGGTGLGLSIAQSIVRTHRGSIYALDNVPKGAKFAVVLPLFSGKEKA